MIKKLLVLLTISQLVACTNQPSSAYESGWTSNTNEDAYATCGSYRVTKGFQNPDVMNQLVSTHQLTNEQGQRVEQHRVQIGDPECLAYAAYGMDRYKTVIRKNNAGETTTKSVTYLCNKSDVPCPGLTVTFSDGKVTSTEITNN
ncbi:hypothetical protein SAMN04487857_11193 [Pseudomonas sp. ok272]|uniref:hypothetical protein n=1 Tax=unclassified Pseudomonas TaxID=196821 RepID=UPI0008D2CF96|nr:MULTISPECIES: hypothetical protein [unclassified Pseudomonas]SEN18547.1 hypothetical protein SAMN04487857_11193 [Pseudomonas sp. ok272]SFN10497.1 hypothetical protein SAMN04487858_11293 [Pseudomonas sp. ok602]